MQTPRVHPSLASGTPVSHRRRTPAPRSTQDTSLATRFAPGPRFLELGSRSSHGSTPSSRSAGGVARHSLRNRFGLDGPEISVCVSCPDQLCGLEGREHAFDLRRSRTRIDRGTPDASPCVRQDIRPTHSAPLSPLARYSQIFILSATTPMIRKPSSDGTRYKCVRTRLGASSHRLARKVTHSAMGALRRRCCRRRLHLADRGAEASRGCRVEQGRQAIAIAVRPKQTSLLPPAELRYGRKEAEVAIDC